MMQVRFFYTSGINIVLYIQWNLHIADTIGANTLSLVGVRCKEVAFNDYVNSGTKISVPCLEVSVV